MVIKNNSWPPYRKAHLLSPTAHSLATKVPFSSVFSVLQSKKVLNLVKSSNYSLPAINCFLPLFSALSFKSLNKWINASPGLLLWYLAEKKKISFLRHGKPPLLSKPNIPLYGCFSSHLCIYYINSKYFHNHTRSQFYKPSHALKLPTTCLLSHFPDHEISERKNQKSWFSASSFLPICFHLRYWNYSWTESPKSLPLSLF